jgi:DNA-binding YbaB/EbfC family protein
MGGGKFRVGGEPFHPKGGGKALANFQNIIKQAQQMQAKMMKLQEELASRTVEASAGGGMVTAVVNGKHELVSLKVEKDVVNPDDVEMLQDLIVAAVNEAKLTGGLQIPGLT